MFSYSHFKCDIKIILTCSHHFKVLDLSFISSLEQIPIINRSNGIQAAWKPKPLIKCREALHWIFRDYLIFFNKMCKSMLASRSITRLFCCTKNRRWANGTRIKWFGGKSLCCASKWVDFYYCDPSKSLAVVPCVKLIQKAYFKQWPISAAAHENPVSMMSQPTASYAHFSFHFSHTAYRHRQYKLKHDFHKFV